MRYSKKEIGEELKQQLKKGYNIRIISTWACDLFVTIRYQKSAELDDILRSLSLMDAGPEFEYTERELRILAELLIKEVKNPIKQIDDRRLKDTG